jgi:hypothetical protein
VSPGASAGLETRMRDPARLPLQIEPMINESGLGFLLRASRANGISLASLFEELGLPRSPWLPAAGLSVLAYAVNVDRDWLAFATAISGRRDGFRCFEWRGRLWTCPLSLRGKYPQICPHCLRESGICLVDWELAGAVACLRHGCPLIDGCPHCGRRLSWLRPAVDVCSCGHYLWVESAAQPGEAVSAWVGILVGNASDSGAPCVTSTYTLPPWFSVLSPDALTAIAFSFGVRDEPFERVTSAVATVPPATNRMTAIIERALIRLRRAHDLAVPCPSDLRLCVYEQALWRLWRRHADLADRDAAARILLWLGARSGKNGASISAPGSDQRELFALLGGDE